MKIFSNYYDELNVEDKKNHNLEVKNKILSEYKFTITSEQALTDFCKEDYDEFDIILRLETYLDNYKEYTVIKNNSPYAGKHLLLLADADLLIRGGHVRGNTLLFV